jgi:hypothetical protein
MTGPRINISFALSVSVSPLASRLYSYSTGIVVIFTPNESARGHRRSS